MRKVIFIAICVCGLLACQQQNEKNGKATNGPPNILLIVSDDQGYADMSCTGLAADVQTPNLDQLAASGVRFTQAYATSPICSPSRAGILTGCYQERWGTFWYGGRGMHDPAYSTLAELLKQENYRTGYIGKVHYGSNDSDTTDRNFPLNHGFDYYFGHTSARKHYLHHRDELETSFLKTKDEHGKKGQSLRQQALWENTGRIDTIAFSTQLFADQACAFVRQNQSAPFFLQLSFNAVHNFTHQLPEDYLTQHNLRGYSDWDPAKEEYYDWYQGGRYPNNPEGRAHYLGQLYYLDRAIGQVMEYLRELKLAENTLVVYLSDNGGSTPIYANNHPLRGSKYLLYEGGIRVPMIIAYPEKFREGEVSDQVVSAMDILPTICRAVGITPPGYLDGKDLTPLLKDAAPVQHYTLVWDTGHEAAVRQGDWKWHRVTDDKNAQFEMVEVEIGEFLRNLAEDPGEQKNYAEERPELVDSLRAKHAEWRRGLAGDNTGD